MVEQLAKYAQKSNIVTKSMANGAVKVNVSTVEDYRNLVSNLRKQNLVFYTYQLKSERPFKVVIRNLHQSISPDEIKDELTKEGYTVRNVANIRHWKTKIQLPLFFVDLEPNISNNKSIYDRKFLLNTRINVEALEPKVSIAQCQRCQAYGHTKTYCTLPPIGVKCGNEHLTPVCSKKPEDKPHCGLCGGDHTANYWGCLLYKAALKIYWPKEVKNNGKLHIKPISKKTIDNAAIPKTVTTSYHDIVANKPNIRTENAIPKVTQSSCLEQLIEKMLDQNSQILEILTKLITKLI